ncbi:MAG: FAS1-like dehydratase domain-containing protein [Actinomycetota bacterium]
MAVDPSFVGRVYPPTEPYEVSREKVREFSLATGAHVINRERGAAVAAGYQDVIVPPTFAIVVAQRCEAQFVAHPAAGIDFSRVVHGDQTFIHHHPIVVGDQLVSVLHIDAIRSVSGHTMVTMRSEISRLNDVLVCTATSGLVVRGESS